ncbi:hypothetical protein FHE72_04815 [Rossellomorea vietnamensis]|uniref:Uncharacterized protein n=1 Tax=Rossellomorea vietnamensis TaxID=218284 RepID=A0A6I6ULK1_9BACI|nr:hypothetical protein [Rossellomorea vietnamensis]QHE60439.1 hypothetical protein FHE72_04815 [Rossellomorea vietnamensis]
MKKTILTVLFVIAFGWISYSVLYNGFSGVKSMTIQKEYDRTFDDAEKVTDHEVIATVTGILNRSNKITNVHYKLAVEPTYKIQLEYMETDEILYLHEGFDNNETLISSDRSEHYYKINQKQKDTIVQLLLKQKMEGGS